MSIDGGEGQPREILAREGTRRQIASNYRRLFSSDDHSSVNRTFVVGDRDEGLTTLEMFRHRNSVERGNKSVLRRPSDGRPGNRDDRRQNPLKQFNNDHDVVFFARNEAMTGEVTVSSPLKLTFAQDGAPELYIRNRPNIVVDGKENDPYAATVQGVLAERVDLQRLDQDIAAGQDADGVLSQIAAIYRPIKDLSGDEAEKQWRPATEAEATALLTRLMSIKSDDFLPEGPIHWRDFKPLSRQERVLQKQRQEFLLQEAQNVLDRAVSVDSSVNSTERREVVLSVGNKSISIVGGEHDDPGPLEVLHDDEGLPELVRFDPTENKFPYVLLEIDEQMPDGTVSRDKFNINKLALDDDSLYRSIDWVSSEKFAAMQALFAELTEPVIREQLETRQKIYQVAEELIDSYGQPDVTQIPGYVGKNVKISDSGNEWYLHKGQLERDGPESFYPPTFTIEYRPNTGLDSVRTFALIGIEGGFDALKVVWRTGDGKRHDRVATLEEQRECLRLLQAFPVKEG